MSMHTVQYSVQPSKEKYTIRVQPSKEIYYSCIVYMYSIHNLLAYPTPTPGGGNKIIYKQTALRYYIIY